MRVLHESSLHRLFRVMNLREHFRPAYPLAMALCSGFIDFRRRKVSIENMKSDIEQINNLAGIKKKTLAHVLIIVLHNYTYFCMIKNYHIKIVSI